MSNSNPEENVLMYRRPLSNVATLDVLDTGIYTILAEAWNAGDHPPISPRGVLMVQGDNGYGKSQIFFGQEGLAYRTMVGTWSEWKLVLDTANGSKQFANIDGSNITQPWDISITGSASSAKSADSANVAATYLPLSGGSVLYLNTDEVSTNKLKIGDNIFVSGAITGSLTFDQVPNIRNDRIFSTSFMGKGSGLDAETVLGFKVGSDLPVIINGEITLPDTNVKSLVVDGVRINVQDRTLDIDLDTFILGDAQFTSKDGFGIKFKNRWQLKYDAKQSNFLINNQNLVLHDGNISQFGALKDGSNVSGVWNIDINGSANSVNGFGAETKSVPNTIVLRDQYGKIRCAGLVLENTISSGLTSILVKNGTNEIAECTAKTLADFIKNSFNSLTVDSVLISGSQISFTKNSRTSSIGLNDRAELIAANVKLHDGVVTASDVRLGGKSVLDVLAIMQQSIDDLNNEIKELKSRLGDNA